MSTRDFRSTRRQFLKGSVAGTALSTVARPLAAQQPPVPLDQYQAEFFDAAEWIFLMAATARLIPAEGDGPGALETRVPVFIDREMASDFGKAATWYMEGPHVPDAAPLFGYQSPLTPAEVYRGGIKAFNEWCSSEHGAAFPELDAETQDAALTALEAGDVPLDSELRDFFSLLLQNTKEGYFADPRYGGNYGMAAWVHIGFPGARASFLEWTDPSKDNVPYPLGPVSIAGDRA